MKIINHQKNNEINVYKYETDFNSGGYVYVLKVSPNEHRLSVAKAQGVNMLNNMDLELIDTINNMHTKGNRLDINFADKFGLIKVSDVLNRTDKGKYAINGGFYLDISALDGTLFNYDTDIFYGDPVGWLRIKHIDYGLPLYNRPVLKIYDNHKIEIDNSPMDNAILSIHEEKYVFRKIKNEYVLVPDKMNVEKIKNLGQYEVLEIKGTKVSALISGKNTRKTSNILHFPIIFNKDNKNLPCTGDIIKVEDNAMFCVTMSPQLVKDYMPTSNIVWDNEDYGQINHPLTLTRDLYEYRAARTGIFVDSNSNLYFAVSDNNKSSYGEGLTLNEFTELVISCCKQSEIKIKDGYYLDGGSSSVISKRENGVSHPINTPSGISNPNVNGYKRGDEAHVGIAIIVEEL